mmetsp:Transcript_46303/g.111024  ORF Transcript_46303/g.111024 Transcript_46303/m.111024 type:complete len:269 (+) Transcript_46303:367-1173(+)
MHISEDADHEQRGAARAQPVARGHLRAPVGLHEAGAREEEASAAAEALGVDEACCELHGPCRLLLLEEKLVLPPRPPPVGVGLHHHRRVLLAHLLAQVRHLALGELRQHVLGQVHLIVILLDDSIEQGLAPPLLLLCSRAVLALLLALGVVGEGAGDDVVALAALQLDAVTHHRDLAGQLDRRDLERPREFGLRLVGEPHDLVSVDEALEDVDARLALVRWAEDSLGELALGLLLVLLGLHPAMDALDAVEERTRRVPPHVLVGAAAA